MAWSDSQVAASDVLKGRLIVESLYDSDNGKKIVVTGTTTDVKITQILSNKRTIFKLPAQERYLVEMISTERGVEFTDFSSYIVLEAGGFARIVIELASSSDAEDEDIALASWEKVQSVIDKHQESSYFRIGDEVDLYLEDENHTHHPMIVAGINHEWDEYPHSVTFVSKYCLPETAPWRVGSSTVGGYENSEIRPAINGPMFYDLLPAKLKELIPERKVRVGAGNNQNAVIESEDKIWLPAEREVFGRYVYTVLAEDGANVQYPLFCNQINRVKTLGENGATTNWWLSSPAYSTQYNYCVVYVSNIGANGGNNSGCGNPYGILPCFHLVAADTMKKINKIKEDATNG